LCARACVGSALAVLATGASLAGADVNASFVHVATWQSRPVPPAGVILDPVRIQRAADGSLFVTDRSLHRVGRYTPDGDPLEDYGYEGRGDGQLRLPLGAAGDVAHDRVYVADTGNDRVAIFNLAGQWLENWSLGEPEDIEVLADGRVLASNPAGMTVFAPNGTRETNFPLLGRIEGGDLVKGGFAFSGGVLYVAALGGVQRYRLAGEPFGYYPAFRGVAFAGRDVAVDALGNVFGLSEQSTVVREHGGAPFEKSLGGVVNGIAGGERQVIYAAKAATRDRRAGIVQARFTGQFQEQQRWGDPLTILGWIQNPLRITSDASGDIYVTDELYRVQRFTADGSARGQLSLPGLREAVRAPAGDIFVARERFGTGFDDPEDPEAPPGGSRKFLIERHAFAADFVSEVKQPTTTHVVWQDSWQQRLDDPAGSRLIAMALSRDGSRLYVLDAGAGRVLVYGADGNRLSDVALPDLHAGLPAYTDLALDDDGDLLVLHTAARRYVRFSTDGELRDWHATPEWAWRLDVLTDGRLAVITALRQLWILAPDGRVETIVPLPRSRYDTGEPPTDIAVGSGHQIYVTDRSGTAVFVFAPGDGPTASPVPGRLGCRVFVAPAVEPFELPAGGEIAATLRLTGACDEHPRMRQPPLSLAISLAVSVTLPAGFEPIAESASNGGRVDDRAIGWSLSQVPSEGVTLTYRARAMEPGRRPMFATLNGQFVDGWYGAGTITATAPYVLIRPPSGTASLRPVYLPAVRSSRAAG
jgi:DNA-binding beta-propeller fold protein YncE